jgi:hypothetical protein
MSKLTPRQFLALVYLDAKDRVTPEDLPMARVTARAVLSALARENLAAYTITDEGRTALAAARDEARGEAGT